MTTNLRFLSRALLGLTLAAGLVACGDDDPSTSSAESGSSATSEAPPEEAAAPEPEHQLVLDAADFTFDGTPVTVPAGLTEVTLHNHGAETHQAAFLRYEGDSTFNDVVGAILASGTLDAASEFGTFVAGPNGAAPAGSVTTLVDLEPGRYAVVCFIPGADGVPHVVKGMMTELAVEGEASAPAPEPTEVPQIALTEFAIELPDEFDGSGAFEVVNEGAVVHEFVITELLDGHTVEEALAAEGTPEGPSTSQPVNGTTMISPGGRAIVELDLPPGEYVAICYAPADATSNHAQHGMVTPFTVA